MGALSIYNIDIALMGEALFRRQSVKSAFPAVNLPLFPAGRHRRRAGTRRDFA